MRIRREKLRLKLTTSEIRKMAERYHFQESDHPEIDALYRALCPLLRAEVCCLIHQEKRAGKMFADCAVTLGAGMDIMQERLLQEQKLLWAYMLDCLGNTLLEKAYRQTEQILTEETGWYAGRYAFPGEHLSLDRVREILDEMEAHSEGLFVCCNEACMMQPKKSAVYVLCMEKEKRADGTGICDGCGRTDCVYRQEGH